MIHAQGDQHPPQALPSALDALLVSAFFRLRQRLPEVGFGFLEIAEFSKILRLGQVIAFGLPSLEGFGLGHVLDFAGLALGILRDAYCAGALDFNRAFGYLEFNTFARHQGEFVVGALDRGEKTVGRIDVEVIQRLANGKPRAPFHHLLARAACG